MLNASYVTELTKMAEVSGLEAGEDTENLRNGFDRQIGSQRNGCACRMGIPITFNFEKIEEVKGIRLVFDSDLSRTAHNMPCNYPLEQKGFKMPGTLIKSYKIQTSDDGVAFENVVEESCNCRSLRKHEFSAAIKALRFVPIAAWGEDKKAATVFSVDVL